MKMRERARAHVCGICLSTCVLVSVWTDPFSHVSTLPPPPLVQPRKVGSQRPCSHCCRAAQAGRKAPLARTAPPLCRARNYNYHYRSQSDARWPLCLLLWVSSCLPRKCYRAAAATVSCANVNNSPKSVTPLSLSLSLSRSLSLPLALSLSRCLSLALSLALSLSLSFSLALTLSHTHSLSFPFSHSLSVC